MSPTASHFTPFSGSAGNTKAACQAGQLFLCHSPRVTRLRPSFSSSQESNDIIVPTAALVPSPTRLPLL